MRIVFFLCWWRHSLHCARATLKKLSLTGMSSYGLFFISCGADSCWFAWNLRVIFLKDTRQLFEVSLIQCFNTRYGFPKHSIFSLHGVVSNLLACGPRVSSALLTFPCGSFSQSTTERYCRNTVPFQIWKGGLALLSPVSWYWIEAHSLHKTELNYRSVDGGRWLNCTNFVTDKLLLQLNTKES